MRLKMRDVGLSGQGIWYDILKSRGIEDPVAWKNVEFENEDLFDYGLLCPVEMSRAQDKLLSAIINNGKIAVVVDTDVDGYTSSAVLVNYLIEKFAFDNFQILFHRGKEHGLNDLMDCFDDDVRLVITPDAGSNDIECHKILKHKNVDVIVLDHHIVEETSDYAIVVNNQISDHPSKAMTGVAVTWLFCKFIEETSFELPWVEDGYDVDVSKYLDLVALGCLSDMADYRDHFVRTVVDLGTWKIQNAFIDAMCKKQEYSMNKMGGKTYMAFAFYVTPYMNAVCRTGTMEEKEMMFKALVSPWCYTSVPSTKRGSAGQMVPLYEQAVYVVGKAKERQTDIQNAGLDYIEGIIEDKNLNKNAVLIACCDPDEIDPAVCGLIANKLQSKYQKPAMVLRKIDGAYKGSARNYSMSEIEDLKGLCDESGLFEYCAGHSGAFGMSLPEDKLSDFVSFANNTYQNVSTDPVYWIDYMLTTKEFRNHKAAVTIDAIAGMAKYWGQQVPEAKVGVRVPVKDVQLIGASKNTIKMNVNGVDIIKFKASPQECVEWTENTDDKVVTIYGTCKINEYNGTVTPQILIEDYFIEEELIF